MPIEPKTWETGETITASSLNFITPLLIEASTDADSGAISTTLTPTDVLPKLTTGSLGFIFKSRGGYSALFEVVIATEYDDRFHKYYLQTVAFDDEVGQIILNSYIADGATSPYVLLVNDSGQE